MDLNDEIKLLSISLEKGSSPNDKDLEKGKNDVYINDVLLKDLEFSSYAHPNKDETGIIAYISSMGFKKGKNVMRIERTTIKSKKTTEIVIPFWFLE